ADEDREPDAGEDACLLLVDADVDEGLYEHFFTDAVDTALVLGDDGVGAGPAADGALGLVVDGDGDVPEQVNALERIGCGVHLLLELVDASRLPLLEEGGVELTDACEVGVEAAGGDAQACAQVGDGQRADAPFGEQVQGGAVVVVLALAHQVPTL